MSEALVLAIDQLDAQLRRIEQEMTQPADGDLACACGEFQRLVVHFQTLFETTLGKRPLSLALTLRLRQTAAALAATQENLRRRAVLTQQALQTLVPATQSSTYDASIGARAYNRYPSAGLQSGEFQVVAA